MKPPFKSLIQAVATQAADFGFIKRRAGILVMPASADVVGWVGLNHAADTSDGSLCVNPVVGVRHQRVESELSRILGESDDGLTPPTVAANIGYISPESAYQEFELYSELDATRVASEIVDAIRSHGLPFIRKNTDPSVLLETLISGDFGIAHQTVFRVPLILRMLGRHDEVFAAVEDEVRALQDRNDPAADRFRRFARLLCAEGRPSR